MHACSVHQIGCLTEDTVLPTFKALLLANSFLGVFSSFHYSFHLLMFFFVVTFPYRLKMKLKWNSVKLDKIRN